MYILLFVCYISTILIYDMCKKHNRYRIHDCIFLFVCLQELQCSNCGKLFKSSLNRRRHEDVCKNRAWRCKWCNTILSSKRRLNNHEPSCQRRTEQYSLKQQNQGKQVPKGSCAQQKTTEKSDSCGGCRKSRHSQKSSSYTCGVCNKSFAALKPFLMHRSVHYQQFVNRHKCHLCPEEFSDPTGLAQHIATHAPGSSSPRHNNPHDETLDNDPHPADSSSSERIFRCSDCDQTFVSWHRLHEHRINHRKRQSDRELHEPPWEVDPQVQPPWSAQNDDGTEIIDTEFKKVYEKNRDTIVAGNDMGRVRGIYNFALNDFDGNTSYLSRHLNIILSNEPHAFRINASFGIILRNVITGEYRYYCPYYNATLLDTPFRINKRKDMEGFLRTLEGLNLSEIITRPAESTKWRKVFVTNISYYVYRTGFHIGVAQGARLPKYLHRRRCLKNFYRSQDKQPYKDNLCIFRCLAWLKYGECNLQNRTKGLYYAWRDYLTEQGRTDIPPFVSLKYKGITLEDLPDFERCFGVRTCVYSLNPNRSCTRIYVSSMEDDNSNDQEIIDFNLNMYGAHFSLITDFRAYARKYACRFCGRTFVKVNRVKNHERICCSRVKYKYPGGIYNPSQSVFEELEQNLGICVDKELQFYPYFAVYDFESVLRDSPQTGEETQTKWITEHIPVCVSVSSNVPGYENPHCIIQPDPDILVQKMCEYLETIQIAASKLAAERWKSTLDQLNQLKTEYPCNVTNSNKETNLCDLNEETDSDNSDVEEEEEQCDNGIGFPISDSKLTDCDIQQKDINLDSDRVQKIFAQRVASFCQKFQNYVTALPVLGFNSSRYDLNLIKCRFPKHLNLVNEAEYVVKKCNQYTAIVTSKFRFLDISNYLAAGCSYSKFLKAYDVSSTKSYFPYEWFDDVSKLKVRSFPAYECFYSRLKNANVLEIEYTEWEDSGGHGVAPKTGHEKYEELLHVWHDNGMKEFWEFLEYYVNLDTGPFVEAAEKLKNYYFQFGVDLFKVSISAPGVARKLLFEHAKKSNIYFASFSEEDADLYHKIKRCAFGGPSIIFKRYAKVGETFLRNNKEVPCQNICGYDSNSLYLWALGLDLPVLMPIRRLEETNFKPKVAWRHLEQYQWLNWIAKSEGIQIQHKLNSSKEFPVGPYKLDGYAVQDNVEYCFEFNGCFTHGHPPEVCGFRKNRETPEKVKIMLAKKHTRTRCREAYLRSRGMELRVIYECEFAEMKKNNPEIHHAVDEMLPSFYLAHPHQISSETILKGVESGELTGMLQVDIRVPEKWPPGKERDMTPREYFSEMSPIFSNSEVSFKDWGTTMQQYSLSVHSGGSTNPRKLLIGGMAAEKVFLSTHLLKWYLEKGLEVTHVYEVVEYKFKRCFEGFCEFISDARRKGDRDPTKEILGETCKVLGNASYGSLLLDKTKHTNVKFVHEKTHAHMMVNDPLFKKLSELPDEMYEIEMSKKVISLDIPIQIAFCILSQAKVHLLRFVYDCLDVFIDRKHYEITHCDTDSIYMTLAQPTLLETVIPHKKTEFEQLLYGHCNDTPFKAEGDHFFPRECCEVHKAFDKRERGLFKLEASGTELIALASKTYFLSKPEGRNCVKAKGINKCALVDPMSLYTKALFQKTSSSVQNIGFRPHENQVFTYSQERRGFSYFYVKRIVLPNGIDTMPLDLILNPWENYNTVVLSSQKHCLSNDYPCLLRKQEKQFRSCSQLYYYEMAMSNGCPDVANEIVKAKKDERMYHLVKNITVKDEWYACRDEIMMSVIQLKIDNMKYRIIVELEDFRNRIIVHPGSRVDRYWTCGIQRKLAQITPPAQFPGENALSKIWYGFLKDDEFMKSFV